MFLPNADLLGNNIQFLDSWHNFMLLAHAWLFALRRFLFIYFFGGGIYVSKQDYTEATRAKLNCNGASVISKYARLL